MYQLSEQEIDFILNDIKSRGVEMEDLQMNLLDHICCILEAEYTGEEDFKRFYAKVITRFFNSELKEIEEETTILMSNKHYYAMKKTMIVSGISAVILLVIGSFFKLMHWPGAGILLVLGVVVLSLLFLPLLFLTKKAESKTRAEKVILGLGALVGILYCLATLFKIQHWPGATQLWYSTIVLSAFVFIPVYFFNGIKQEERKGNTIITTILLVGATSVLFMMMNTRPAKKQLELKMYNYLKSEELLSHMKNQAAAQPISKKDSLLITIDKECDQIKSLIYQNYFGEEKGLATLNPNEDFFEDGGIGPFFNDEQALGGKLIRSLTEDVKRYNLTAEQPIPFATTGLGENLGSIANYNIYSVLTSIVNLQLYVAYTKS